ncbi:MAG: putative lipid II flippase FtsW [Geovibrio sp.]|uniref:putative lipid II flippase FtsW n=1 Tax=Geovibrio ferrireducens TaxID=46201 RepID=UPI002246ACE8|nr:putative lipid II flippase FtsW [Geovibrio ferrireducens]MCD8568527.1 putative lipid II flippase FtsW [Geovibrio sp.]
MFQIKDERLQILIIASVLITMGLIFVFSAGSIQALRLEKNELYFFNKQLLAVFIGLGLMYGAYSIPLKTWRRFVPALYFLTLILLISVFFFPKLNGSHRWILLPGFSLQPSELAKFTCILYLAHYLDKKEGRLNDFTTGFLPASIMLGIIGALILSEPDYGTTLLIICVSFTLFLIGGAHMRHIIGVIGFIAPIITAGLLMGYRRGRIMSFLDPWEDRYGTGYQLVQSLTAVGSGGIFGKGVGNSSQKLYFLPEAHTDFIYAIIAEETGLVGSLAVLVIVTVFFIISVKVALKHKELFYKLLTFGLAFSLFVQALLHISVVTGLLPTKGIGLPLVSYGGSNMMISLLMVGVLLRSAEEAGS